MNRRAFISGLLASAAVVPAVRLTPPHFARALADGGYTVFDNEAIARAYVERYAAALGRIQNQIIENIYRGPSDPSPGLQVF